MRLTNKAILFFILAIGAILRFWNFGDIPFSHDEFSALFRTEYSSFQELIDFGVKPDGHPAGIQVFLYYWTGWFGKTEWIVKLPFALLGLLSIGLIYAIAKEWFNDTVGLLSATLMACLQYPVVYSVTARPYISGMFFVLAMVWFWTRLVKYPNKPFVFNSILYILFSALCAYNHHFSLLFAVIVGLSGLFFIPKKALLKYALCGLVIFLLYVPHLSIFFHQLGNKGIEGWLAKPEPDFLWNFIRYIFHYSWILLFLVIGIVGLGIFQYRKTTFSPKPFMLFLSWFMLPFLIGYFYSTEVNSVLQYSVLIFSFPFLFFVLFGHLSNQTPVINFTLVIVIALVSIFTLNVKRQHFRLLYNSHYQHIVSDIGVARRLNAHPFIIDSHHKISQYYQDKEEYPAKYVWCDLFENELEFRAYIRSQADLSTSIYFGAWSSTNPNYESIIKEYYPNETWVRNYLGGSTHIFSQGTASDSLFSRLNFKEKEQVHWNNIDRKRIILEENSYLLDSLSEWSPTYKIRLGDIVTHKNNTVRASVRIKPISGIQGVSLVAIVEENGKTKHWSNVELSRFVETDKEQWQVVHQGINLSDVAAGPGAIITFFVWNQGKEKLYIKDFEIRRVEGNKVKYGLRDDF